MNTITAEYVLRSRLKSKDVFALTAQVLPTTLLPAQHEALNLVWALWCTQTLRRGDGLVVVGGTLGGITAAIAAQLLGCKVTLIERGTDLFGTGTWAHSTRRMSPTLDRWPAFDAEASTTRLPFFNWQPAVANKIGARFLNELHYHLSHQAGGIELLMHTAVADVEAAQTGLVVMLESTAGKRSLDANVVVFATSGTEAAFPGPGQIPFWELERIDHRLESCRSLLVSGLGEAAFCDVIHTALVGFDSEELLDEFCCVLTDDELNRLKLRLAEIDFEASSLDPDVQSELLQSRYADIALPEEVMRAVQARLRPGVQVYWTSPRPTPFSVGVGALRRLLAFSLLQIGRVEYICGTLDSRTCNPERAPRDAPDGSVRVDILTTNGKDETRVRTAVVDAVLVRHGIQVHSFLKDAALKAAGDIDPLFRQLWPRGFYAEAGLFGTDSQKPSPEPLPPRPAAVHARGSQNARDAIVKWSAVKGLKGVHVLGSYASRVTFSAQQTRAFNLVWALHEHGKLAGRRIAVIGGGLAGMTAAAAASLAGSQATLIEAEAQLLHLQRDCRTRYVHPNIYDWPQPWSERAYTQFPCMNWHADMAEQVTEQIARQWRAFEPKVELLLGHRVDQIDEVTEGIRVGFKTPAFDSRIFDLVILAVGFGTEASIPQIRGGLYWNNDSLDQTIKAAPKPRHFLVTGCGDGALIDVLRLCIDHFDHKRFTDAFDPVWLEALREPLLDAEHAAQKEKDEDRQSKEIERRYRSIRTPDRLVEWMQKLCRNDTVVCLNGEYSTPLSLRSSTLNRFLVYWLLRLGKIEYQRGRFNLKRVSREGRYVVTFRRAGYPVMPAREFDEVVVRHGPGGAVRDLLPEAVRSNLALPAYGANDPTREPLWPLEFLEFATAEQQHLDLKERYARNVEGQVRDLLRARTALRSLTVKRSDGCVYFHARIRRGGDFAPTHYNGIAIQYDTSS